MQKSQGTASQSPPLLKKHIAPQGKTGKPVIGAGSCNSARESNSLKKTDNKNMHGLKKSTASPGRRNVYRYVRRENRSEQDRKYPMGKEDTKMNNKGAGTVFCLIAALLFGARYIAAGPCMSSSASISA